MDHSVTPVLVYNSEIKPNDEEQFQQAQPQPSTSKRSAFFTAKISSYAKKAWSSSSTSMGAIQKSSTLLTEDSSIFTNRPLRNLASRRYGNLFCYLGTLLAVVVVFGVIACTLTLLYFEDLIPSNIIQWLLLASKIKHQPV